MGISILIADEQKISREGLISMLRNQPNMDVVGEAENGREAVELARKLSPDIVIMDVTLPGLSGIDSTHVINKELKNVKVIALSTYTDKRFVRGMVQAGALGYLLKNCGFDELLHAIYSVVKGHVYLSPEVASVVLKEYLNGISKSNSSKSFSLTDKERQILKFIAKGMTTKKIASKQGVSVKTIETHRRKIMGKLGVRSIAELTKYAIQNGLASLEI
ncbi:MAG: response regulator transcription factor [Pseudomonadota bacterium]